MNTAHYFQKNRKQVAREQEAQTSLLNIDQYILKIKKKLKNVAMALIDIKNVYNMVPQILIIECQKTYKISDKVINFIKKSMENWK